MADNQALEYEWFPLSGNRLIGIGGVYIVTGRQTADDSHVVVDTELSVTKYPRGMILIWSEEGQSVEFDRRTYEFDTKEAFHAFLVALKTNFFIARTMLEKKAFWRRWGFWWLGLLLAPLAAIPFFFSRSTPDLTRHRHWGRHSNLEYMAQPYIAIFGAIIALLLVIAIASRKKSDENWMLIKPKV